MRLVRPVTSVLAAFLTVSCSDGRVVGPDPIRPAPDVPTPVGPSAPGFAISDALHGGGNAHFFWLPPMVPDPAAFNGGFDGSQSPVVRICDLSDCETLEIATYSMSTGPGSETVRVVPSDEQYVVNWHTNEFDVTSGPTYRIAASVSGTGLGYADIQLGSSGNEVKNLTTNETIGLKDGRTLPIIFRIELGAVFAVSAVDGGTIEALDGTATLDVPAGALAEDTGITVEAVPSPDDQAVVVELGPDGLTFDPDNPITVTLAYDEAALGGIAEDDLALNTFEDGAWIIVPGSSVDVAANTASAPFFHFSKASVGPAAKAVVCPGDNNPNTFDTFDAAIAALMDGGTLTVCDGTHTVQSVVVDRALTIEGKAGTRPVITSGGARYGLMMDFQSGTMTIRNLRFETLWNLGFSVRVGSALVIGSLQGGVSPDAYDQVIVEDVELHVAQGSSGENAGSGAWVVASDVPGAHVTFRNVTATAGVTGVYILTPTDANRGASVDVVDSSFSGAGFSQGIYVLDVSSNSAQGAISDVDVENVTISADLGVFAGRGTTGVGARVDITNSSFSGGALWYQSGATGLIQGNTIDCGHGSACIRVRSGAGSTQIEPVRIIDNDLTGATRDAIWLTALDAGPFEIVDNVIAGVAAGVDRSEPFDYSFHGDGIRFDSMEVAGTVSDNSISGAYRALSTDAGSVAMTASDNTITAVWTGARVVNGGQMSVQSSDFTDYIVPIDPTEPFGAGSLTCNWWGGAGPQGVDPGIPATVYTPWATTPVAGSTTTTCTGM